MAKLKDLKVNWLSFVKTPANQKAMVLKSGLIGQDQSANPFKFTHFVEEKSDDGERRVAYAIVYAPDEKDLQDDYADAQTIRRAAYDFMKQGRLHNIDEEHDFDAKQASVVESWIVRENDALFSEEAEGAWAVGIQVGDPDLWNALKSGELTGISLAGWSREEAEIDVFTQKNNAALRPITDFFAKLMKHINPDNPNDGDIEMSEDEISKVAVKAATEAASAAIGPAITEALKSAGVIKEDDKNSADNAPLDIAASLEKGFAALNKNMENTITKALAKGASETGDAAQEEESIL